MIGIAPDVQVSDVRALRALGHPLRDRQLGLLRPHGVSTAGWPSTRPPSRPTAASS